MSEQANDELGALAAQAAGLEAAQDAQQQQPGQGGAVEAADGHEITNAEIIAGAMEMARDVGSELTGLQSIRIAAADEDLQKVSVLVGRVCDKRGWNLNRFLGQYAEEVAAAVAVVALGRKVMRAVSSELAWRERQAAAQPDPAPAPEPAAA